MVASVAVGLVDDGVVGDPAGHVLGERQFVHPPRTAGDDSHGTAMAAIITTLAPSASLYDARVFPEQGLATPAALGEALAWLVEQRVELVNISLGLREDRAVLRHACAHVIEHGIQLVAAAPAQGPAVYPSAYPGVLRVTGDARCAPGEYAWLDTRQAVFGACVGGMDHLPGRPGGGASCAVAHVTGAFARLRAQGIPIDELSSQLRNACTYSGPERHHS